MAGILAVAALFACTPEENNSTGTDEPGGGKDGTVHVTGISLDHPSATIKEGETITLVSTVTPDNAANKTVKWSSCSETVATVDGNGKVTGIKAGSATITATTEDGGKKATCALTVEANLAPSVTVGPEHISAISVVLKGKANLGTTAASDLKIGFQYSKSAGIMPSNSTTVDAQDADSDYNYTTALTGLEPDTKYYFRSFVRQNGQDTYGETKEFTTKEISSVLETLDATGVEATSAILNAKLDLTDVKYESVKHGFYWGTFEGSQNTFINGDAKDNVMTASMTWLNHKTQYWYKAYVKLDSQTFYGVVKTFTTDVVPVESVSVDKTEYTFHTIGSTLTLNATVLPSNASDKSVEWSSDKKDVATVTTSGVVTAKGNGTATITVKTKDQEKTATCAITVAQWVTSVTLNNPSLTLNEGQEQTLIPTVNPSNAADKSLNWVSSDTSVATVNAEGKVTAVSKGTATIKAEAKDGSGKYASCSVTVKSPSPCPSGAVDLGLSVYWGTSNLGASKPEDYGDYYAWGEVEPYYSSQDPLTWKEGKSEGYAWLSYKWCNDNYDMLTKYCPTDRTSYWDGEGSPDGKKVLDPEDDAAHVQLGGNWRMPTDAEWTELMAKCTWTWVTNYNGSGINGRLVKATNGNSIFLPAAGFRYDTILLDAGSGGCFWSSSLNTGSPYYAWFVYFSSGNVRRSGDGSSRCLGRSVRPVSE